MYVYKCMVCVQCNVYMSGQKKGIKPGTGVTCVHELPHVNWELNADPLWESVLLTVEPFLQPQNSLWLAGQPAEIYSNRDGHATMFSWSKLVFQVKYHEDFEKHKGCFTPVVTDPITERVKKNTQDFSDINYRGIQRKVVEIEQKRNDQDQDTITGNWEQGDQIPNGRQRTQIWEQKPH